MSLRARLIAGMLVVSFVLVAVAFIIARTTEANLVDRVDQQLVQAGVQVPSGTAFGGPTTVAGPTAVYSARIQNGVLQAVMLPNVAGSSVGAPKLSIDRAL